MELVKSTLFRLFCLSLVSLTDAGWEKDAKSIDESHCRLLEAELQCRNGKCQAKKELVIWEEELIRKIESEIEEQHLKSDSLLREIRKE